MSSGRISMHPMHLVVLVVLVLAAVGVGFMLKGTPAAVGQQQASGGSALQNVTQPVNSGQSCSAAGAGTPTFNPTGFEINFGYPRSPVSEAVKWTGYDGASSIPAPSQNGAYTGTSNSVNVVCGHTYTQYYGDNVNFFVQKLGFHITNTTTQPYVNTTPISAPTITFSNSSQNGYTNNAVFYAQGNGQSLATQLQVKINAGAAGNFGYPCMIVVAEANTSEVTNIYPQSVAGAAANESINGANVNTAQACPVKQVFNVPAKMLNITKGYNTWAYQVPAVSTSTGALTLTYSTSIGTLPSNTALSANVDFVVVSQTGYNNNNQYTPGAVANATGSALVSPVQSFSELTVTRGVRIFG